MKTSVLFDFCNVCFHNLVEARVTASPQGSFEPEATDGESLLGQPCVVGHKLKNSDISGTNLRMEGNLVSNVASQKGIEAGREFEKLFVPANFESWTHHLAENVNVAE